MMVRYAPAYERIKIYRPAVTCDAVAITQLCVHPRDLFAVAFVQQLHAAALVRQLLAPVPAALAHPSGLSVNAAPIAGLAGLLGLSCLGWVLMRKARNEKLEDLRRANEAVVSLLSTK